MLPSLREGIVNLRRLEHLLHGLLLRGHSATVTRRHSIVKGVGNRVVIGEILGVGAEALFAARVVCAVLAALVWIHVKTGATRRAVIHRIHTDNGIVGVEWLLVVYAHDSKASGRPRCFSIDCGGIIEVAASDHVTTSRRRCSSLTFALASILSDRLGS